MTSGPMRAGALPPDRQPDPQVVAWMRDYRAANPEHRASDAVQAYLADLSMHSPGAALRARHRLAPLVSAWSAAKPPLTVADIPARKGAASLYIGRPESFRRTGLGEFALLFKRVDGSSEVVDWPPEGQLPGSAALWEHLAATLPTIDATEEST